MKLPKTRVDEPVASKLGQPFDPGHGRSMKERRTVTSPRASWFERAREAWRLVSTDSP